MGRIQNLINNSADDHTNHLNMMQARIKALESSVQEHSSKLTDSFIATSAYPTVKAKLINEGVFATKESVAALKSELLDEIHKGRPSHLPDVCRSHLRVANAENQAYAKAANKTFVRMHEPSVNPAEHPDPNAVKCYFRLNEEGRKAEMLVGRQCPQGDDVVCVNPDAAESRSKAS